MNRSIASCLVALLLYSCHHTTSIQKCVDGGGRWDYNLAKCVYSEGDTSATTEPPIHSNHTPSSDLSDDDGGYFSNAGRTVGERFTPPTGYVRSEELDGSFQNYLRNLTLKPPGALVHYYNGEKKPNADIYAAVVDLPIGNKDLHQCADAIMRLRAEYLWRNHAYDSIHFYFTNGYKVEYRKWMQGYRMNVKGNKTWWSKKAIPSNTYKDFWDYMELIFMYAGTASLEKELKEIEINDAAIGDILIQGGHPGHAAIIVDKAVNRFGDNVYLLAQSYMPAQEIQIVCNPSDPDISPWYVFDESTIVTPEWNFYRQDLKRFSD